MGQTTLSCSLCKFCIWVNENCPVYCSFYGLHNKQMSRQDTLSTVMRGVSVVELIGNMMCIEDKTTERQEDRESCIELLSLPARG